MEPLRFNNLELRLARNAADLDAAQALRYRIFYEEMGAKPSALCREQSRDMDRFDEFCDHLLVIDLEKGTEGAPYVVGTYRFLRSSVAKKKGGFYSESEFDLCNLTLFPGEIMELGRSCIDAAYRRRGAMQLLWRGIASYIHLHDVQIMFGCGSIHGTDLKEQARVLSYLHHFHKAPGHLRPRALEEHYIPMKMMKRKEVDIELAQRELPPLLKGYLRLGGYIGDGAVIDHEFNTIDVCVIVETENVTSKYIRHFSRDRRESEKPLASVATGNPVQIYS
ncbi:GNAT family N-acyltransferase [uncultured Sneathiella sp.]|uniref:GNAT family N-acetyltransferase n=1 Tax=uncultured Sneathiella sp. TaxID=879315 RepID=UPI00259499A8|nr:GNAT family N-acyltransferase [uncultured Sneathiella sp.]